MNRFVEKLYFFTKLTTSSILLIFVIFLSYLLLISYKNTSSNKIDISSHIDPLKLKIQQNQKIFKSDTDDILQTLSLLDKKTQDIENNLKNINSNLNKITELKKQIEFLQKNINEIKLSDFSLEQKKQDISKNTINEKEKLKETIIIKFKNNLSYDEELKLLENLYGKEKKFIFEKITIIENSEFVGIEELKNSYAKLTDKFIKKSMKNNTSIFPDFLIDLITIRPSENAEYSNQNIYYLKHASNYLKDDNILDAISSIKNIEEYEKYFSKWLSQAKIFVNFKNQIERI